uniref:Glucose and ribitol dehydrogenase n=1 Tax=Araucaria cunninghamii TaxID=56994 RepID=A0A0D6R0N8_ARACU
MSFPPQQQDSQPGLEYLMVPRPIPVASTYRAADKLKGKVALVTGGDSGIGRAVCYHFALEGATVAFTYVSPAEEIDADETLHKLVESKAPDAADPLKIPLADLGNDETCKKVVDDVVAAYGGIDILVNCAAENHVVDRIEDMKPEQVERTFRTNIFSQFFIVSHAVKHMKEGANIINTLSRQAYLGMPSTLDYASSKGAILTFTRGLARQLAKRGIRVNGVAPGPIWTPVNVASLDAENVAHLGEETPMGRAGQPCEVAPCYVFLASQDASYITGQVLHPNGGHAMYS